MEITKVDFKLHSIIMLVGPDNSGKTEFSTDQLVKKLKLAETGRKKLKIAHINYKEIMSEITGGVVDRGSFEYKQAEEQVNSIVFNKVRNMTSYPVNFDFVIIDSDALASDFREEIVKISEENHYNLSAVIFNYKDQSDVFKPYPGQLKELRRVLSGELSKNKFDSLHMITSRDFCSVEIKVSDYEEYESYVLPEDREYVIFSDVHGCLDEFKLLLIKNGFKINENDIISN